MSDFKRILIFNPFGIGDVLFCTPVLRAVKTAFPDSSITYVCNERVRYILRGNPCIDYIIIFEKDYFRNLSRKSKIKFLAACIRFFRKLKAVKADLMLDFSLNYQASLMGKIIGIPRRIGFNYKNRGKFLTDKIPFNGFEGKHVVFQCLEILGVLGVKHANPRIETFVSQSDEKWAESILDEQKLRGKYLVGVIPGGGMSWGKNARYRRWPVSNFAHTVDKMVDDFDITPILFGDSNEAKICDNLAALMRNRTVNMGGKTNVGQFMALIKKCRFVLCNEGGPLHIAVALDVPTVSIFGPVDEKVYGPFAVDKVFHIVVTERGECDPCYSHFKHKKCELLQCLNALTVDKVFSAVVTITQRIKKNDNKVVGKT